MLELPNTQCKHQKDSVDVIISKFNTPKNIIKYYQGGVHLQYLSNHYEY